MTDIQSTTRTRKPSAPQGENLDVAPEPDRTTTPDQSPTIDDNQPPESAAQPRKGRPKKGAPGIDVEAYQRKVVSLRNSASEHVAEANRLEAIVNKELLRRALEEIVHLKAEKGQ
jgi:hypothetical protein